MRILVTGSDGYIGSVLVAKLMEDGNHEVVGLDTGFYRQGLFYNTLDRQPLTLTLDTRDLASTDLHGFDAVVHLAELSNDPLAQNDPAITFAINHKASAQLAETARRAGVKRFIYASSCSVYGVSPDDVTETSPVDPQTAYATCKVLVERDVRELAAPDFSPVFLRNATAFGPSPRMRFDIVLNDLAGLAWTTKKITMTSDGSPWRPLVHVSDISQAIIEVLHAPREAVHNEIFNVGDNHQNYRVREIAEIVAARFEGCVTEFGPSGGDNRSYRVNFDKIHHHLPNFRCRYTAADGAAQLRAVFERIAMTPAVFSAAPFRRLSQLRHLLETRQIDPLLRWTDVVHQTFSGDTR